MLQIAQMAALIHPKYISNLAHTSTLKCWNMRLECSHPSGELTHLRLSHTFCSHKASLPWTLQKGHYEAKVSQRTYALKGY